MPKTSTRPRISPDDRRPERPAAWSPARAARQCVGTRAQATKWLRQPIAGGMRAGIELEHAALWCTDRGIPVDDKAKTLREWFSATYDFRADEVHCGGSVDGAGKVDTTIQAMPLTTRWLTDRADCVDTAHPVVASPAAVAVAAAAAQALTEADVRLLAADTSGLPFEHAHLLLSAPILTVRRFDDPAPDDVLALTWWGTDRSTRIVDWLATNGPVVVDGFDRARRTSARSGTDMPALYFHGERALSVDPGPVDNDPLPSEGEFTFDDPVYDPDWDFLPRFVLAFRHLVASRALQSTAVTVMRPDSRRAVEKRIVVDVVTAPDDRDHTIALLDHRTSTRVRRTRSEGSIRWQPATVIRS